MELYKTGGWIGPTLSLCEQMTAHAAVAWKYECIGRAPHRGVEVTSQGACTRAITDKKHRHEYMERSIDSHYCCHGNGRYVHYITRHRKPVGFVFESSGVS